MIRSSRVPRARGLWTRLVFIVSFVALTGRGPRQVAAERATVDPAALARQLLDNARSENERKKLILQHAKHSLELLEALVRDMPADDLKEEYRRIPWIWRIAVEVGKRNDVAEMRPVFALGLPKPNEPLREWQAVLLGGGIIHGIGLAGAWPDEQLEKMVGDDGDLKPRWTNALVQAGEMVDDPKVVKGTRYDALRIIALDTWDRRGAQLFRFLVKGTDDELQTGALSALGDMRSPYVAQALLSGFAHYSKEGRNLALEALLREPGRTATLLDAIQAGVVKIDDLGSMRVARLTNHRDGAIRARAKKALDTEPN